MTVTITTTAQPTTTPPSVALTVTTTTETSTTILRNNPDGSQTPVRTGDGNPLPTPSHSGALTDYEVPFGRAVSYTSVESPATISSAVTLDPGVPWLIHPGVPALSLPITFREGSLRQETFTIRQGIFYPMGRANAVVITDGVRKNGQASITLTTQTLTDLGNLTALLSTGSPLLLNIPASMGTGFDPAYIAVADVQVNRWTDSVIDGNRDIVLPFVTVDAPVGGSQASRSYVDLLSFASYSQMQAAYTSYTTLLTGP